MTRVVSRAALLSALLAIAVPSMAQDALNKRLTLDLKAMAPREAFGVIATAIGYTVDVAPEVSTPVDIVVRNITARTALNTICESIGCTWQASGTVIRVRQPGPGEMSPQTPSGARLTKDFRRADQTTRKSITAADLSRRMHQALPADMKFENAPLAQVAERLSKATGFVVTFAGNAKPGQTFTADLGGRTFSSALAMMAEQFEGNLVCRIEMPRDSAGRQTKAIAIQIGRARK